MDIDIYISIYRFDLYLHLPIYDISTFVYLSIFIPIFMSIFIGDVR